MRENSIFSTPVKYTLVCSVSWFLGPHDTLYLNFTFKGNTTFEGYRASHVLGDDSHESTVIDRSALHDTSELERLRQLVSEHESTITNLEG